MKLEVAANNVEVDITNFFNMPVDGQNEGNAQDLDNTVDADELDLIDEDEDDLDWDSIDDVYEDDDDEFDNDNYQDDNNFDYNDDDDDDQNNDDQQDSSTQSKKEKSNDLDDAQYDDSTEAGDDTDEDSTVTDSNKNDDSTEQDNDETNTDSSTDTDADTDDDSTDTDEPNEPELEQLTDAEFRKLVDAITKQEDFMNPDSEDKAEVSQNKSTELEALEDAGVEVETVGDNYMGRINTIVVKKLSQELIDANPFRCFITKDGYHAGTFAYANKTIENGIRLGTMLGRKLQIRNEERSTVFSRLHSGKIDKRLLGSLGYGAEQVFSQMMVDKFNPVYLHISVDASGSMNGSKWEKTMIAVVAICKAASMVSNLDVSVDFRLTTEALKETQPLVIIAYDSRIDKFEKVRRLFPYITCPGTTPEGLCFEAISKFMKEDKTRDQYFINFSDGEPYFSGKNFYYSGSRAINHTKKQVQNMRDKGIKILSYFISEGRTSYLDNFKQMYGTDAQNIDVTDLIPLAKSINKLFAEK